MTARAAFIILSSELHYLEKTYFSFSDFLCSRLHVWGIKWTAPDHQNKQQKQARTASHRKIDLLLLPQPYLVWKLKHATFNASDQKYFCLVLFRTDRTTSLFVLHEHHHRLLFTGPAPTVGVRMLQVNTSTSCAATQTLKATANILDTYCTVLNKWLHLQMLKRTVLLFFSKMQSQFIYKSKMYLYV